MAPHDERPRIIDLITSFGSKTSPSSRPMKHVAASASSKTNAPKSPHEQRLAASHLRPTIARTSVLDALEKARPRCLDASQTYRLLSPQFQNISPGAIYRALNDLWTAGLLIRTEGERGRGLYTLKPDRKTVHQDTLRCHCGARLVFIEDSALREHLRLLASEEGFDLDKEPAFTITMTCAGCQSFRKGDR